jgi:hypothetical protein
MRPSWQPEFEQDCESAVVYRPNECATSDVVVASPPRQLSYTDTSTQGKSDIEKLPNSVHEHATIPPNQLANADLELVKIFSDTTQAVKSLNLNWDTACIENGISVIYASRQDELYKVKVRPDTQHSVDVEVVFNLGDNQAEASSKAKALAVNVAADLSRRLNEK